jgi:hypothetical protein
VRKTLSFSSAGKRLLAAVATVLAMFVGLGAGAASATSFIYSENFTQGTLSGAGTIQGSDFNTYIAALPTSGLGSLTLSGSNNPTGKTCNTPATAQQIADALRTKTPLTVTCNGDTWYVGTNCGPAGNVELAINQGTCSCGSVYSLRPLINNDNWGGINGATCGAASQTISLEFDLNAIPTLSPWMMGILVAMIAGVGLWLAPRRFGGGLGLT